MLLRFSIAAVLGVALLAGCGGKSSAPTGSEPANTTGTTTASKNALPADLVGTWRLVKPDPGDVVAYIFGRTPTRSREVSLTPARPKPKLTF
jgi:hypothetical protein